jgi:hypothetical protein
MVAVDACSHTPGGRFAFEIACPTARTDSTRDRTISFRWCGVYRQFTDRPARLITTSASPSASDHPETLADSTARLATVRLTVTLSRRQRPRDCRCETHAPKWSRLGPCRRESQSSYRESLCDQAGCMVRNACRHRSPVSSSENRLPSCSMR